MRVTAFYNPEAGPKRLTRRRLVALLQRAGYEATYYSTKAEGWKDALEDPGDLVVVAGGDGTTAKVAKRLAGRGIPLAILPGGTANNIARSLGLDAPLDELIARWTDATPTPVDLGLACGPWGEELFIEACGLGVFPRMLEIAAIREKMTAAQRARLGAAKAGVELMIELVTSSHSRHWSVALDGRDLSGEYVMLEAMNIRYVGGGIALAPTADATDEAFDVIAVREEERASFVEYLRGLQHGTEPPWEFTRRATRIDVECAETLAHLDDEPLAERDGEKATDRATLGTATIAIRVQSGAIDILL